MLKYHWMAYSLLLPRSGATILPLLHPWIGSSTFPTNMVWLLCPSYELGRACQAFPTHLLLPPPPTKIVFSSYHYHLPLLRYLHYFTTLLLTPTTYLHSSFASAVASSSTFTIYSYYATFTTLLPYYFTPTTDSYYLRSFPWLLRGWTVGGVLVMPVMDASGVVRRGFELWASWVSSLLPVGSTPGVTPSELGWMD